MGRLILATVAGLVAAFITIMAVEFMGATLHPPPPGLDITRPEDMATLMASMPMTAMAVVVLAWILGAFDGGLVAGLIARGRGRIPALVIGGLVVLGVLANSRMIPHPMWMLATGILLPIPAALAGAWLAGRLTRRPAASTDGRPG